MTYVTKLERVFSSKPLESLHTLYFLVSVKGAYLKARDAVRVLGVSDHGVVTYLGVLLNALAKAGLAKRFNNSRPRRYRIKDWVVERIRAYGLKCFLGLPCPHVSSCPIREALKGVVSHEG